MSGVTAAELIALFTGVEHEDGGWITTPTFTAPLAARIAATIEPSSEIGLRKALYGERDTEDIPLIALYAIQEGYKRYRGEKRAA